MDPIKFSLCPHCTECPEVVITADTVTIGEDENLVRLSYAEWNELVRLIKGGDLSAMQDGSELQESGFSFGQALLGVQSWSRKSMLRRCSKTVVRAIAESW